MPTSPLVEKPQTAKLPTSSQKSVDRAPRSQAAAPRCRTDCRAGAPSPARHRRRAGRSPTARGLSGSKQQHQRDQQQQRSAATTQDTLCQCPPSAIAASTGRKTSWPLALLAVSTPTARPRCFTNQRLATVAASRRAVTPDADADQHAPGQEQLPVGVDERRDSATAQARIDSATSTVRRRPMRLHEGGGERTDQAIEHDIERHGARDRRAVPAEGVAAAARSARWARRARRRWPA